jgi:hypothetical protein
MTPGRKRLYGTGALCASASALFIVPSAVLPGAEVSPMLVFVGLVIPAGVAGLVWPLTRSRFREVDTRVQWSPQPEPKLREGVR